MQPVQDKAAVYQGAAVQAVREAARGRHDSVLPRLYTA